MKSQDRKNLKKRYLVWFYKNTKDALDRIERKFTQVEIDRFILEELKRADKSKAINYFIDDFERYVQQKEKDGLSLKYQGAKLKPDYQFLALKLEAVEKAIAKELGKSALKEIKDSYERQMEKRILEERQENKL